MMECQINHLGFCTGCPDICRFGERCRDLKEGNCKYVNHSPPPMGWGAPHVNCSFQDQSDSTFDQTNFEQVLTDKLTICTLNTKKYSDRGKLKMFLKDLSQKDSIVCLQEFRDDRDLMELLDYLKETKSKFTYCGRSSHSHCAVLSTLPLQEVANLCKIVSICFCSHPQVVRDNYPSRNIERSGESEFVTVKVQGILVTCVHLPNSQGGEQARIKKLKRIWQELEKKGLWKEVCVKHIFAGDFNSLTWEDDDEEGWARVAKERAERNMKLDEAISLAKMKKELAKDANSQSPEEKLSSDMENNLFIEGSNGVEKSLLDQKAELEKITAQLDNSLQALGVENRGGISKLIWYLQFKIKRLEEPKFDLTRLMKEYGFKDSWREVKKMGEFGQIGSHITSK